MSKWFHTFAAQSPHTAAGDSWHVGIHEAKFRGIQRAGHSVKLARLALVEEVLQDPASIIRGWDRPETEDCLVYIGGPSRDFRGVGIETPAPIGMVFLVFVRPDGTIDDWCWRPVHRSQEADLPEGLGGETIWPPIDRA